MGNHLTGECSKCNSIEKQDITCPSHPVALKLLNYCNIPLAAPSANKFGHISPTSVEHVLSEFPNDFMYIIDGGTCDIGIESTVVKIDSDVSTHSDYSTNYEELEAFVDALSSSDYVDNSNQWKGLFEQIERASSAKTLTILRKGAVTQEMLKNSLGAKIFRDIRVEHKVASLSSKSVCEAPGMLLRHYAPNVPTYRVCLESDEGSNEVSAAEVVMIDIGGKLGAWRNHFMQYIETSDDSDALAKQLYSLLRTAESLAMGGNNSIIAIHYENKHGDMGEAISDRLYRATSGKSIYCEVTDEISFKW
ncbi:hypothetical protein BEWA_012660 [Theileria equi strain WA]|uniref:Threonylcarbamoyl-AMP synthase n=1 Tax=Theileria equi strain WA TaxID=1537102 RepID=L1LB95_THEEQ|nr:hypothetical protein BEWA_012660 [Theileria equi strain WA]EKX72707.1 hypothetical protein BEWA_012660 [Theileria equi strain WA]|eukprot:XP_004832159.1 hypothetical protein BEWA_012660 [Theileria equi strain WA]